MKITAIFIKWQWMHIFVFVVLYECVFSICLSKLSELIRHSELWMFDFIRSWLGGRKWHVMLKMPIQKWIFSNLLEGSCSSISAMEFSIFNNKTKHFGILFRLITMICFNFTHFWSWISVYSIHDQKWVKSVAWFQTPCDLSCSLINLWWPIKDSLNCRIGFFASQCSTGNTKQKVTDSSDKILRNVFSNVDKNVVRLQFYWQLSLLLIHI